MEKREIYIVAAVGVIVAVAVFASVVIEGAAYFLLSSQLRSEQAQLARLEVKVDRLQTSSIIRPPTRIRSFQPSFGNPAQVQITTDPSTANPFTFFAGDPTQPNQAVGPNGIQWTMNAGNTPAQLKETPAPDSLEGQIVAERKQWLRILAQIAPGAYVEDILVGRAGQPAARGVIGRVVSVDTSDIGHESAQVDFGRGYTTGINFTELSVVALIPKR